MRPRSGEPPGLTGTVARAAHAPPAETISGLVERVTFHGEETGFCVLRVKVRSRRELATVVGHAASIAAGEWVTASGEWVNDRTHGLQFRSRFLNVSQPASVEGIEKYLGSGMIRGIGPVYAKKLVRAFGEEVFDLIESAPARLREVAGIGPVRAKHITAAFAEQKAVREIMVFLHGHGVGTARAVRIFKTYGAGAVQVMSENPYRLARDVRGIGFKTADTIAMRLGIEKTAMVRVRAGVSFALGEAMDEGRCGLPRHELLPRTAGLLEVSRSPRSSSPPRSTSSSSRRTSSRIGSARRRASSLAGLHRAEAGIAERLRALRDGPPPWPPIAPDKAVPWIEERTGLALTESQKAAVGAALGEKVMVITAGRGVGKTSIVNAILRILAAKAKRVKIALAAPTGGPPST